MYRNLDYLFNNLANSKFRSSFHLNEKMKKYVENTKMTLIRQHAYSFVTERLKPACPKNDGRQTPFRQVHPVFIAQHATGTCCRNCLYKWHKISKYRVLSEVEVNYIVNVIMKYIEKETGM